MYILSIILLASFKFINNSLFYASEVGASGAPGPPVALCPFFGSPCDA